MKQKHDKVYIVKNCVSFNVPIDDNYTTSDTIFWKELKIFRLSYNGNLELLPLDDWEEATYIESIRSDYSHFQDWKQWCNLYDSFWKNHITYTVKQWQDGIVAIQNMDHGVISGWWKWKKRGDSMFVEYLGKEKS